MAAAMTTSAAGSTGCVVAENGWTTVVEVSGPTRRRRRAGRTCRSLRSARTAADRARTRPRVDEHAVTAGVDVDERRVPAQCEVQALRGAKRGRRVAEVLQH